MAMVASNSISYQKAQLLRVSCCRRKDRGREHHKNYPYKVVEIAPQPKCLGVHCFPPQCRLLLDCPCDICSVSCKCQGPFIMCLKSRKNLQCGESVTIEGQTYTISAVTLRYQLRKGNYEPCGKRLDVLSTGRYLLNLYLENLLEPS